MKIALVSPYDYPYPGGVTQHIFYLDKHFRELGHQVGIVAACAGGTPEKLPDNLIASTTNSRTDDLPCATDRPQALPGRKRRDFPLLS
jgi:glycosyltransferase involved in cell wall biosynthesis